MAKTGSEAENHYYNMSALHGVFAVSSILMLFTVVWMVVDDHYRPWKVYQRNFRAIELDAATRELQQVGVTQRAEIETLHARRETALQTLAEKRTSLEELEKTIAERVGESEAANFTKEQNKAEYDSLKYASEVAHHENHAADAARLDTELKQLESRLEEVSDRVQVLDIQILEDRNTLREWRGELPGIESDLQAATRATRVLEARIGKLDGGVVDTLRNLPLLDYADPSLKIAKIVVNDLHDDYNFVRVPKIDRCITCHAGIDKAIADSESGEIVGGKYDTAEQPFTSHPRLDLFLSDSSPHPLGRFGCTICHDGAGNETDFALAAHTPRDEEQAAMWAEKYGWAERHHWDYPMLPLKYTQARCAQCHDHTFDVPEAEKLTLGRKLYYDYNCFNCHKTKGFESFSPYGPKLTFLADKLQRNDEGEVDRRWLYNWLKSPRTFRASTRMPHFFVQSNTGGTNEDGNNHAERNDVELLAIAHYLIDSSQSNEPAASSSLAKLRNLADPDKGRELAETIGCFGCHHIGPKRADAKPEAAFGPHLANLANKTTFEWLVEWLRNPQQHWSSARMPDFRLTDEEVAAIASYLITLQDENYRADPVPDLNTEMLDEIVLHYLGAMAPSAQAMKRMSAMSTGERLNYAGEKLIRRYGCYSCHLLEGFDDMKPIGTDQSEAGSKPLSLVDFGFVIPHDKQTRHAWLDMKIKDPRSLDQGRIRTPNDRLIMPRFEFSDEQREALVTFLMSLTAETIPPHRRKRPDERGRELESGRELVRLKNCLGCHSIERTKPRTEDDPADIGPDLSVEGKRVRYDWLHEFVQEPSILRSRGGARMPTLYLNAGDAVTIARYFARVSDEVFPYPPDSLIVATREEKLEGESLFELSNCQSCHLVGDREYLPPTKEFYEETQMEAIIPLAPDLRLAQGRIRTDWAKRWIADPQSILPETKMPNLKLLDRDVNKIMKFVFTEHVDQAEWREWAAQQKEKEKTTSEEFSEFD